jgi:hypothetical protein
MGDPFQPRKSQEPTSTLDGVNHPKDESKRLGVVRGAFQGDESDI